MCRCGVGRIGSSSLSLDRMRCVMLCRLYVVARRVSTCECVATLERCECVMWCRWWLLLMVVVFPNGEVVLWGSMGVSYIYIY